MVSYVPHYDAPEVQLITALDNELHSETTSLFVAASITQPEEGWVTLIFYLMTNICTKCYVVINATTNLQIIPTHCRSGGEDILHNNITIYQPP